MTRAERTERESPAASTTGTANLSTRVDAVLRSALQENVVKRFGAIVMFGGAVLVSTHILAPAEQPPQPARASAADLQAIQQAAPAVDQVNAEVERLRRRLAAPPAYPAPTRDPFQFGTPLGNGAPKSSMRSEPVPSNSPPPAVPELPRLIAIRSEGGGSASRSAVLAVADDLHFATVGDAVGGLTVRTVDSRAIELVDPVSGTSYRLSLD
jgi:hypothetical protein